MTAPRAGYVRELGAIRIGNAAVHLGAGRRTKEDAIDHAVGHRLPREARRTRSRPGDLLAEVHARTERARRRRPGCEVLAAYELGDEPPPERPVLLEVVD